MNTLDPVVTPADVKRDTWFSVRGAPFVVLDASKANHFRLVPEQACTLAIINPSSGRRILIRVEQGGTGYAVTPDSTIAGLVAGDISTVASSVTVVELLYDEQSATWQKLAYLTSFGAGSYLTIAAAALAYQPLDSDLTDISGLTTTAYGRGFLVQADAPAARTKIGVGTISTAATIAAQADFVGADLDALKVELNAWKAKIVASGAEAS